MVFVGCPGFFLDLLKGFSMFSRALLGFPSCFLRFSYGFPMGLFLRVSVSLRVLF